MQRRILIAEDSEQTRETLRQLLQADGNWLVDTTGDGRTALQLLADNNYNILLTDLKMPGLDGMQIIERIKRQQLPTTVIIMTGFGSVHQAVQAMSLGAFDFLEKPIDFEHLKVVIERALAARALQDEVIQLRERIKGQHSFQNILSKSPKMHAVFELISNVAHTTTTVLIEGETGTGKEQVARAIHQASQAFGRKGEMVAVNCAALPENLLESELFGHEKGAFTNAISQRRGRFELADGGTMFLDEAGDIPASMQAKLLRVLQERRFERVGGTTPIEVDVRVIAATHRHLPRLVKQGKFREDLYYRFNVLKIELPPLRERPEDIPLLAVHFTQKYVRPGEMPKHITPAAMEKLVGYHWPGNIRELENSIERACVTARGPNIQPEDLSQDILTPKANTSGLRVDLSRELPPQLEELTKEFERQYLRRALKKARGRIDACAKICGLSRRSISAKLSEYGLEKKEFKETEE